MKGFATMNPRLVVVKVLPMTRYPPSAQVDDGFQEVVPGIVVFPQETETDDEKRYRLRVPL
jgi:hypothetical protein